MYFALLVLSQLLYAINFIACKNAMESIGPILLSFTRFSSVSFILFLYLAKKEDKKSNVPPKNLNRIFYLNSLIVPLAQTMFIIGLELTTPKNASYISTTIPIFAVIFSVLNKQISFNKRNYLGMCLCLIGGIFYKDLNNFTLNSISIIGDVTLIIASLLLGLSISLARTIRVHYSGAKITFTQFLMGSFLIIPFTIAEIYKGDIQIENTQYFLLNISYCIIGGTLIPYFLTNWLAKNIKPELIALAIYLQPLFTALLLYLFYNETLNTRFFISLATLGLGAYFMIISHKNDAKGKPTDKP